MEAVSHVARREPWNKGKIVGQKAPFKLKDIWALRIRLQMEGRVRELALFNLGVDSKLRGCDLVALRVRDVCHGDQMATRTHILERHHPKYWDGSVKEAQTFLSKNMDIKDIEKGIGEVIKQNRAEILKNGTRRGQYKGIVDGIERTIGLNKGRIGQFF